MPFTFEETCFIKVLRQKKVNCAVWKALQQSLYRIPVSNLDDLKDRVRICWESLDQHIINKSIDQWHDRLKAVVREWWTRRTVVLNTVSA